MSASHDANRADAVWDTAAAAAWQIALPPIPPAARVLSLPVRSNRATMLAVDVFLERPGLAGGYKTSFIVEWAGQQALPLRLSSFESAGAPRATALQDEPDTQGAFPIQEATVLRLQARDATFPGTVLEIGAPAWLDDMPLIPINENEALLEDFTATRFWDAAEWPRTARTTLPDDECGLKRVWFFAQPWYRERPGRFHRVGFTRQCRRDLNAFQALTVSVSVDRRALFSLILTIDGRDVAVLDRHRGLGDGEELRVPLSGGELTAITFEVEEAPDAAGQSADQTISALVRWFLLERRGADPAAANEVRGMPDVAPPAREEPYEQAGLPVGILFARGDLPALREKIKSGQARVIYEEILAEAESHLAYRPERFVGRYLPIDYGNSQGTGRMSAPMTEMRRYISAMIYSGLVYALSGQTEHGLAARRALLSTLRCDEWASGFVSRIPAGLPGYRAPFVTAAAACAAALSYDFIHPLLSDSERREVEDALYTQAIPWLDLYLRLYGEGYLLESNQGPVFSRGLIYAALVARRSHADVIPLLDRWAAWFRRMLSVCYEADGSTNEGPSYYEYTTNETVAGLLAVARFLGRPVSEVAPANLPNSMDYMLHMRSLASETLSFQNIGDCTTPESKYMSGILLCFARCFGDRRAQWMWNAYYAGRPHPPGNPFFGTQLGAYASEALLTLLWLEESEAEPPRLPPAKRFAVCDRVFWRTGAARGDTLVFFEGGKMIPGHAHNDKGQFLLEAFGERLVADPGMVNYADPAAETYHASACHNVVTIRGRDQSFKDLKRAVVIEALEDTERYSYLRADVSGSYKELDVITRRLLFVRPDYVVVLDDVASREDGLEWRLHFAGPLTMDGLTARVDAPGAGLVARWAASCPLETRAGAYYEGARLLTSNLTLAAPAGVKTMRVAALLVPYSKSGIGGPPTIAAAVAGETVEFRVAGAWGEDVLTCQLGSGRVQVVRRHRQFGEIAFAV